MKADTPVTMTLTAGECIALVSVCLGTAVEATPDERISILKIGQRAAYALGNAAGSEVIALAEPELPLPAPSKKKPPRGRPPGARNKPKPPPPIAVQTEIPGAAPADAGGAK